MLPSDALVIFICLAQAALPFKSKPKVPGARRRQTLEQKRAVVLEPAERRTVALIDQLNALRNEKATKKRAKQARQREVRVPWETAFRFVISSVIALQALAPSESDGLRSTWSWSKCCMVEQTVVASSSADSVSLGA